MDWQAIVALIVLVVALLLLCGAAWAIGAVLDHLQERRRARDRADVDEVFRQDAAREALRRMYRDWGGPV